MASFEFKTHRVTELPATLEAYAVYFVAPVAGNEDYVEIYVTSSDGSTARRVINEADVTALIDTKVAEMSGAPGSSGVLVLDTLADRLAVDVAESNYVYVVDATDDSTVNAGGASYLYNSATEDWVKVSESESLDLVLDWDTLVGKPTSTVADIDAAVAASHTHTNQSVLDKVGEDEDGKLTYDGTLISGGTTQWATTNW